MVGVNDTRPTSAADPTTFTYDPADPTPAVGGRIINPAAGGYRDNRKLEERADVLTFTSPPLIEPLEVIGNPILEVVHQTDNPHADLFVRVCEVRKNGRSMNVSDGFQRLEPEKSSGTISIRLDATAHRFTPGVRIRLQISEERIRVTRGIWARIKIRRRAATSNHHGGRSSMVTAASPVSPCRARPSGADAVTGQLAFVRTCSTILVDMKTQRASRFGRRRRQGLGVGGSRRARWTACTGQPRQSGKPS